MTSGDKGNFKSSFGFLMASIGVAIGLGNIWGFPYKMGDNGGFAFLLVYIIMAIFLGYPLLLTEFALGRKSGKGAVEAFHDVNKKFAFVGVLETLVPFMLLCFYCLLGGIVTFYMIANLGDIFNAPFGTNNMESTKFFGGFISNLPLLGLYTLIFLGLTSFVVYRGIEKGIEKVCTVGMPLLFLMLIITVIRCCTLPNSVEGLKFMFKPDFSVFQGTGWFKVVATAGSQMFFSISLCSGALIAYASYMPKDDNLEKSATLVPILDTTAALLAGMAVFPAVFSAGLEPSGGPGLLFVSLQTVFDSMGKFGSLFGFIFYFLVFVASFSSSIGMMEGGISALMDARIKKGKNTGRTNVVIFITITTIVGSSLVAMDQLGGNPAIWKPFGLGSWLDVFDLVAEGILMPLCGLLTAIILGWARSHYIDDEILISSSYKTQPFVKFCLKFVGPILMAIIVFFQISSFLFSNTAWYQSLLG